MLAALQIGHESLATEEPSVGTLMVEICNRLVCQAACQSLRTIPAITTVIEVEQELALATKGREPLEDNYKKDLEEEN